MVLLSKLARAAARPVALATRQRAHVRVHTFGFRRFSTNGPPKGFESWWKEAGRSMKKNAEKGGSEGKPAGEGGSTPRQPSVGQLIALGGLLALLFSRGNEDSRLPIVTFQEMLNNFLLRGQVERLVVVNKQYCRVHIRPDAPSPQAGQVYIIQLGSPDQFEGKVESVQKELGIPVQEYIPIQYVSETSMAEDLLAAVPTLVAIASLAILVRFMHAASGSMGGMGGGPGGRNIFSVGKAFPAGKKDVKSTVRFNDVAGLHQAKIEVTEFVDFLKKPAKFQNVGARLPKGGLLVGPPGTGKTLLAKAVAGEADCPFFSMSGSDFIEMFVGVGPSRVRDLFKQAREKAPSIIFIDEIDAIGRKRGRGGAGGGNDERENTLNQMLVEMDGFSSSTGVVVLAGTNRADILDNALTRPGRFDRQIAVDKPDLKERKAIFLVHLKPITIAEGLDMDSIAQRMAALTPGFSGADIANVCNESAIFAARRNAAGVEMKDFEQATERVMGGLPKEDSLMSEKERKTVALHESGHALAGWFLKHADPLLKVSIQPRSNGALGFAQYLPEEMSLHSQEAILDKIAVSLGGRAAEEYSLARSRLVHQMILTRSRRWLMPWC